MMPIASSRATWRCEQPKRRPSDSAAATGGGGGDIIGLMLPNASGASDFGRAPAASTTVRVLQRSEGSMRKMRQSNVTATAESTLASGKVAMRTATGMIGISTDI